jgi:hypothetical protein
MFKTKKKFLVAFLSLIVGAQYSCKKDIPETESVITTEEMYSAGTASTTADMIQTSDGGYIMVGTSYANNDPHGDIVAIKTDSRGVQQWSTSMGKAAHQGTGSLAGYTINYQEEGAKVVEELDGSFSIAGNRTYHAYANPNSTSSGIRKQTKIVLYKLSATGTATTTDGIELRSNTEFTDQISDFKIDASNGSTQYILTGYTTDVQVNKPNDSNNGLDDLTDIFTVSLDASFNVMWSTSSLAYGFSGQDYGTSIQILPTGYLVVGTSEERTSVTSFNSRIIAVVFEKTGGTPMNVAYFANQGSEFESGYSVYDATNQLITIVGNIVGVSASHGQMAVLQINDNLVQTLPSSTSSNFEFINPTPPSTTHAGNTFKASSIALIPNNGGFVISSTLSHTLGKDICITKLASDFSLPATGWPHYYGLADGFYSNQKAVGPVLPIVNVNGTVEYAYTGTFKANTTSTKIGWVLF